MHNLRRFAVTFLGRCRNEGIKLRPDSPYIQALPRRNQIAFYVTVGSISVYTAPRQRLAQKPRVPPRYETIQFQDRRGTTSHRQGHHSEITVFMCKHPMPHPIWSGFAGARAIRSVVQTLQKSVTEENIQSNYNLTKKTLKSKVAQLQSRFIGFSSVYKCTSGKANLKNCSKLTLSVQANVQDIEKPFFLCQSLGQTV